MSPDEEMERDLRALKELTTEIMFILRGSHAAGTTGIVQDFKSMRDDVSEMAGDVAHLLRFKKRIEESTIDHDKREREKTAQALEMQKLRRDSQLKTWGIIASIAGVVMKMLFDLFVK